MKTFTLLPDTSQQTLLLIRYIPKFMSATLDHQPTSLRGERQCLMSRRVVYYPMSLTIAYLLAQVFAVFFFPLLLKQMLQPSPGHLTLCQPPSCSPAQRPPHSVPWVSEGHREYGQAISTTNSYLFVVEKRVLRVRRDQTAQPLMFLQNYLVDKCGIINLNPLAKRIYKYLNNGLFRVLPVYQTCHMSTLYSFLTAGMKRAELNLMDGF